MKRLKSNSKNECIILHFADGDTVYVATKCEACQCFQNFYLRIRGIESYELLSNDGQKAIEIADRLSKKYKNVVAELIPSQRHSDKYGRVVGDIILEGVPLSEILVRNNDAWYIDNKKK